MLSEIASVYALLATPGVGYVAAGVALRAAAAVGMPLSELIQRSGADLADAFPSGFEGAAQTIGRCDGADLGRYERMLDRLASAGGQALLVTDRDYPAALSAVLGKNAPPVVTVLGNLDLLDTEQAGIVGARDATPESCGYASDCARHFAAQGIGVVSGAARGVDTAAHAAALACGGASSFVLPHGILRYRGDESVRGAIEGGRAVLVSEFAPDARWASHAAILRNKTIAALSRVLCVFEPRSTGGSVRTAEAGLAQAKPVLVHCLSSEWRVEQRLAGAGARALPVHDGPALREALTDAWNAEVMRDESQQELF